MKRYVLKRIGLAVPTLFGVSVIVFLLVHIAPGDPVEVILGQNYNEQLARQIRERLLLDQALYVQYFHWMTSAIQGDLGTSIVMNQGRPVTEMLINRFYVTAELAVIAMAIALLIAIPTGIISAVKQNSASDHIARIVALTGVSIPDFYLGIILIILFGVHFSFPWATGGYTSPGESLSMNLKQMLLPAITLGTALSAVTMRMMRSTMLDVLDQEYIQVGKAFGVSEARLVLVDAAKNAFIPVITVIGLSMGRLLNGAVLTETVFRIPGIGSLVVGGIFARDYPVIQAVVLFIAVVFVVVNLLVDITYAYLDPRIRYGGGE